MRPLIEKDIEATVNALISRQNTESPNAVTIKELNPSELESMLPLVWRVFCEFEAPCYPQEGVDKFYASIHDEKYLSALHAFGAWIEETPVGIIAAREAGAHIALFFVEKGYQGKGIGKMLFQKVLGNCKADKLTVNSSPYAVSIYHKLGFHDTDKEQTVNGIRFTPMERII